MWPGSESQEKTKDPRYESSTLKFLNFLKPMNPYINNLKAIYQSCINTKQFINFIGRLLLEIHKKRISNFIPLFLSSVAPWGLSAGTVLLSLRVVPGLWETPWLIRNEDQILALYKMLGSMGDQRCTQNWENKKERFGKQKNYHLNERN